jgi:hypothetical protein
MAVSGRAPAISEEHKPASNRLVLLRVGYAPLPSLAGAHCASDRCPEFAPGKFCRTHLLMGSLIPPPVRKQKRPNRWALCFLAERVGFEPTYTCEDVTGIPVQRLRPLGHLSDANHFSALRRYNPGCGLELEFQRSALLRTSLCSAPRGADHSNAE